MARKSAEISLDAGSTRVRISRTILGVGGIGLEPTTSAMSTQRSNQLSQPPNGAYYNGEI